MLYLYKELLYMGKDYPIPYEDFCHKLRTAFKAKKGLSEPKDVENALALGEHIKREMIALHKLRIYRAMKRNYNL